MGEELQVDPGLVADFLDRAQPGGPFVLGAIPVEGGAPKVRTFGVAAEAGAWAARMNANRRHNLYWIHNRLRAPTDKKPEEADVQEVLFLHIDVDPQKPPVGASADDIAALFVSERVRILSELRNFAPRPSIIVDSGGGYQAFWRLAATLHVSGDRTQINNIKRYNVELRNRLGGDNCQSLDHFMRLPGTINWPDKGKRGRGREERLAVVVEMSSTTYALQGFAAAEATKAQRMPKVALEHAPSMPVEFRRLIHSKDLNEWALPHWVLVAIIEGSDPAKPHHGRSRSDAVFAVCCACVRANVPDDLIAGIISDPRWAISAHVIESGKGDLRGYAWRQVLRAHETVGAEAEPFQTDKDKKPFPNQHNIRLALSKLGATVRHDIFADRMMVIGLEGCGPHLDDAALDRLYLRIDGEFHFRPTWEFFVKVVVDMARQSAFHPVRDYLDSLCWDGRSRLDRWLSSYGGAADTPYVRAVGSLMLIAGVRRIRHPGVKFDEMLVMESEQGTNKSSALRVLATRDDWFIDDLPLNAESKVVIERLAGRWIVEAAELKGMRKGEVEHLKGFLSRQQDTARMSYARMPVVVPRQCVLFGTTNSERYLRDLTGNRRFWPVKVRGFELDRLRADLDQLWAEAAEREAAGESNRLDPALWCEAELEQDARRLEDPFTGALAAVLGDRTGKISAAAVWNVLRIPAGQRTQDHNARVGDAMRELGFDRKKLRFGGPSEWGYARGSEEEQRQLIVVRDGLGDGLTGVPF